MLRYSGLLALALAASAYAWWPDERFPIGLFVFCALAGLLIAVAANVFFSRRIGGVTGDICGAIHEMAEVSSLLLVTAWLGRST